MDGEVAFATAVAERGRRGGGEGRWGLVGRGVLDEDLGGLAEELLAVGKALLEGQFLKLMHAVRHGLVMDEMLLPAGGGSALARGEGEDVGMKEADLVNEIEGLGEEIIGFAGETDDDIGGQSRTVEAVTQAVNGLEEIGTGVLAVHLTEDGVGAALERKVEMRHDLGVGGQSVEEVGSEVAGLKAGEAQTMEARDLGA